MDHQLTGMATVATKEQYQFLDATQIPTTALEAFYDEVFPARASFLKQNWRWLYRVGESEWANAPLVAVANDQVIGSIAQMPMTLACRSSKLPAAWLVDLAVLPEHQRRGVAIGLIQAAMAKCPLNLGFGNEKSTSALIKCGWRLRQHAYSFQLLLRPELHPKLQEKSLTSVGKVAGFAVRTVWRARASLQPELKVVPATREGVIDFSCEAAHNSMHVLRSAEFLEWRILNHPAAEEHFILSLPGRSGSTCSAIARLSDSEGFRKLHLLALSSNIFKQDDLSNFFAGVVRWAVREKIHRILLVTSDSEVARVARRWFPISSRLRFIYHTSDPAIDQLMGEGDHFWECIDNDFDLT